MINERNNAIYEYITTHKDNEEKARGLYFIVKSNGVADSQIQVRAMDSLFRTLSDLVQRSAIGKTLNELIAKKMAGEEMTKYNPAILNLKLESVDNKVTSIKETGSKYILLDFWSSWCGPCRYKNKLLAKHVEITKNKKVEIIAISLDENRSKWLQANRDDQINYLSLCDLKGLNSPLIKEFKIGTIPQNVLIDNQGNILKRNLWDEDLYNFINNLP